jgi:FkbM family methyltransferase
MTVRTVLESMNTKSALRGRIGPLVVRFGRTRPVRSAFTLVDRAVRDVQFARAADVQSLTVGDAAARFRMTSRNEFGEFRRLPERPIIEDLIGRMRPSDVFYDVGANVGVYACLADSVLDTEVVAFDPEPDNARRLAENVALNDADVTLYRYALSDEAGTAEFAVRLFDGESQTGPAGHSLVAGHVTEGTTITVETVVGDEFVASEGLPTPTVVKIDVEGAEWQVLTGLRETLSRPECRLVYCELHDTALRSQGRSPDEVIALLEQLGYEVEVAFERAGDPFVRAERRE